MQAAKISAAPRSAPPVSRETLTGRLLSLSHRPILVVEDEGEWRLEIAWMRWRHLLGRCVHVTGTRTDYDLIKVESLRAVGPLHIDE